VWLYYRFGVSLRDVSELMLARGIEVSHEAIRLWTLRFGTAYARRLRRTQATCSNIWHLDALCLMINGERGWLWRAVDDAGEVLEHRGATPLERTRREAFLAQSVPTENSVLVATVDVAGDGAYAFSPMMSVFVAFLLTLKGCAQSRAALQLEVLALRHQLQVLERSRPSRALSS